MFMRFCDYVVLRSGAVMVALIIENCMRSSFVRGLDGFVASICVAYMPMGSGFTNFCNLAVVMLFSAGICISMLGL